MTRHRQQGGRGVVPPTPPRDGPKNQLTFLFKAFFSFFSANHILPAVICIKMEFFSTQCFWLPRQTPLSLPPPYTPQRSVHWRSLLIQHGLNDTTRLGSRLQPTNRRGKYSQAEAIQAEALQAEAPQVKALQAGAHGLRLYRQQLYGSEAGGGGQGAGGGPTKLYTHLLRFVKNLEKSLDLAIFLNFADLPQGGQGVPPPPPICKPGIQKFAQMRNKQIFIFKQTITKSQSMSLAGSDVSPGQNFI